MIEIAQIHPMLVHFPIVLFMAVVVLDTVVVARGGNLAARQGLAPVALGALVVGTLFAAAAAGFGDMALDRAVDVGFPTAPLETHQALGVATLSFFGTLAVLRVLASWTGTLVTGKRAAAMVLLGLIGVGLLLATAYFGGYLVYDLGVNVIPVRP